MSFRKLGESSATVMQIFAERDAIEIKHKLTGEIHDLELQLYHERLPSIEAIMYAFNKTGFFDVREGGEVMECTCVTCRHNNRCDFGPGEEDTAADDYQCKFVPRWNCFLCSIDATVHVGPVKPMNITPHHCDSDASIYTNDCSKWSVPFTSWGKPLYDMTNDSRRLIWDAIIAKVRCDKGWQSVPWDGVSRQCNGNCNYGDSVHHPETYMMYDGSRCDCRRCGCGVWVPANLSQMQGGMCVACLINAA